MKSIIKVVLLFLFVVTNIQAKISQGKIKDGLFDDMMYEGNVVNNKFTEEVKIFCKRDNSSINYYINYVNDIPISGTFHSCENEKLKNEIKYGIHSKKDLKPTYDYSFKGKFNSNAKKEDDLLTNGMDAIMKFYNTNSFDILKGKYYKIDGDETMVYLYVFGHNGAIEKHFMLSQHYEFEPDIYSFDKANEYLLSILNEGRCSV